MERVGRAKMVTQALQRLLSIVPWKIFISRHHWKGPVADQREHFIKARDWQWATQNGHLEGNNEAAPEDRHGGD